MVHIDAIQIAKNAYNLVVSLLLFIPSVIDFFHFSSYESIMVDIYVMAAAVVVVILETVGSERLVEFLPVLKTWLGRGVLYILLGLLVLGHYVDERFVFALAASIIVVVLGALALTAHFLHIPMSTPMINSLRGERNDVRFDAPREPEGQSSYQQVFAQTPTNTSSSTGYNSSYQFSTDSTPPVLQPETKPVTHQGYEEL